MIVEYGAFRSPLRRRYLCDISGVDGPSRPKNISSTWHTKEDNEKLFNALGTDTFSIATGLCVLKCSSKGENLYDEFKGIATFAKDFVHRCNYIRIYHVTTFKLLYELELLDMFFIKVHRSDRRRLTIKMGSHYADLSFAERSDMLLFKKKLIRIGIDEISPSLIKRIQNYWDSAKKFFGGIIYETESESYLMNECSIGDDVGLFTPKKNKLMLKKHKSGDFSKYSNNNSKKRSGVKRKITSNEIEPIYHTTKKTANEYQVSSIDLKPLKLISITGDHVEETCKQINLPLSPPDTPKGVSVGAKRSNLQFNCKTERMDIDNGVIKSEVRHVNFNSYVDQYSSCHSEFTFPNPSILKGAIRTVPRPNRDPPPPPPIPSSFKDYRPENSKVLPSDLLSEIRSAPQLRRSVRKNNNGDSGEQNSPLHLIRSAMSSRRKSMKQEEDESDDDIRNMNNDTPDWSITEGYDDIKKYNRKHSKY
uniref:WH2 domain-containing protein n=1 Tax=Parastrongyloides trichosuri TaxID=131310 RepID=A0A0N4ZDS3_PARTI